MDKIAGFVESQFSEEDKKAYHGGNIPQGGAYPPVSADDDEDLRGAAQEATKRAGESGTEDMFKGILGMLGQKKQQLKDEDDVDEEKVVSSHKKWFGDDDDENKADNNSLGSAAAVQALKMFAGQGSKEEEPKSQSSSAFVAIAMSEASKLFDAKSSQGKVADNANKESAVMQAGELALKMYLKSQGGGAQSGGTAGLLSMASKFM